MPSLGNLWYQLGIKDLTDADLQRINTKLKNLGAGITLTPEITKALAQAAVPTGIKIELTPTITNEALAKAVENKVMKVEVSPLLTNLRKAIKDATTQSPVEIEVGPNVTKLRNLVTNALNRQGYTLNISTVNDSFAKVVQQKLNGRAYTVTIHANAAEIVRSVQASLMQVQSRYFGLQVSRDILRNSIDQALMGKPFNIQIAVMQDQARRAVQNALNNARMVGKDEALAFQRLKAGEFKAAQAEIAKLKAAHMSAADAAKAHATASVNLGGAMGSNIRIAGELGSAMASMYSISAARQFLSQVIEIGGELEHQKIAMDTIFGDKGKTAELFGQIKGLARQSPFGVMELTSSVKRLSAYGVEYNEIYDTAKRLADISAATSVDINRLILAFGKTKSRGFLDGLEAKQFAYANIPIYEMVRKKLEELEGQAVTTADVMARMKRREISFDIVKDVLWDITDPGGKFYNMQEALAGSVKTSWKLVKDNIELMFGEIAESSVGGVLKDVAEILQSLTRNWRTLSAVGLTLVSVFGMQKLATFGLNRAIEQSVGTSVKQILVDKQKQAANLRSIRLTQTLTAEEERLIRTSNRLTAEDLKRSFGEEKLSSETARMLFLTKQLSREEINRCVSLGLLDAATAKSITGANMLASAWARAKVAMSGIGQSIGMALGAVFNWTTAIFAAIGAVAMLFQRSSEFNKHAKESSEGVYTKAAEGAENLKKILDGIKPSDGLPTHELTQGIEQMKQAIKDYSPTPIDDVNNALIDQKGHVRELTEQYDIMHKRLLELAGALDGIADKKTADALESAIKNTKRNFLSDDIEKQYQDLGNAIEDTRNNIVNFERENKTRLHEIVKEAAALSPEFRKAIAGMTNDEKKFMELAMNSGKYWKQMSADIQDSLREAANGGFWDEGLQSISRLNPWNAAGRWNNAEKAAKQAAADLVDGFKTELKNHDTDISQYTEDQLRTIFNTYINGTQLTTDMKRQMKIDVGVELGISLIEEDPIGDALKEQLKSLATDDNEINSIAQELGIKNAKEVLKGALLTIQYEGYESLSPVEKQVVDKLMADANAKVMKDLGQTNAQMASYLASHPLTQLINIVYRDRNEPSDLQKELWNNNPKLKDHLLIAKDMEWFSKWTNGSNGYYDTQQNAQRDIKAIQQEIAAAGNASAEWKKAKQEELDAMKALAADMNLNVADSTNSGGKRGGSKGSSNRDPFADAIKERINLLKKAKSEYESLSKLVGSVAAAGQLADSPIFEGLKANNFLPAQSIPQTLDEYEKALDELQKMLTAKGLKNKKYRELNVEIEQVKFDIKKKRIEEELKLALDKVTKEAERQLADWNLYDKVRKATGNKKLAMNIAFGINAEGQTDYVQMIKERFNAIAKAGKSTLTFDTATPELLAAAPEEVRKAWEKANDDILKYYDQQRVEAADLYNEYQTLADKITAINGKRQRALEALYGKHDDGNGNMVYNVANPDERKRMAALINSSADWEIYRQGEDYLRFFSSIYSLALNDVRRIGETIKLHLNEQFREGKLNIKEYADEIRKVNEQIQKAENAKSPFLMRVTSGKKGEIDRKIETEEGKLFSSPEYKEAIARQIAAYRRLNELKQRGVKESDEEYQNAAKIAAASDTQLSNLTKSVDRLREQKRQLEDVATIFTYISQQSRGMGDIFNDIKTIAKSTGMDVDSDGFDTAEALVNTMMAVANGMQKFNEALSNEDYAGMAAAVSSIAASATSGEENKHDRKKSRKIKKAAAEFKQLQAVIDGVNRRMEHFLGNGKGVMTDAIQKDIDALNTLKEGTSEYERTLKRVNAYNEGGAYSYQRQLMEEQMDALQKQYDAENSKKDKDVEAMQDIQNQMDELRDQMLYFAEDVANDLYGIDLKGWASQLGDGLFEAWKKGEDGAEAFKRTAMDILGQVMNKVLTIGLLEPMMQDLSDYLFGTEEERKANNGKAGAFGTDFELKPDELEKVGVYLMKGLEGVDAYNSALDTLDDFMKNKYGISMKGDEESKSGLSAGIQSVTEDTADLLASYLNAVRADVAQSTREYWPKLLNEALPGMSIIAESQLKVQEQIASNTLRNAVAAELIVKSNDNISRLLVRVTQGTDKFHVN